MPLTNVWTRDGNGEWVRTDAEKTDRNHRYTVSADSRMFRCYSCFQYVTFVKGSEYRVSHFRHSSSETNKDCEDRSQIYNSGYASSLQANAPDPLRLLLDGNRVVLEIGFLPASTTELKKAVDANTIISIHGSTGKPDAYRVDYSRFAPHTMCWLNLPLSWASKYSVTVKPSGSVPRLWSINRTALSKSGDLFDCKSGRRIPEKSDVMVGKEYYFLCSRWIYLPTRRSIQMRKIEIRNDGWNLYQICARSYTDEAADFFFDLHLRLTTAPADIDILWPPVVEDDDMIDTNQKNLVFLVSGESDFEAFPTYGSFVTSNREIAEHERIIYIKNTGALQMVSASRYNQKLRSLYVRPLETTPDVLPPSLQISDEDRKTIAESELAKPPKNGILVLNAEVDAYVDVSDQYGFCYRKSLVSGTESRITDIKYGMTLTVRQGLDIIRTISIKTAQRSKDRLDGGVQWSGKMVQFPRRYAGILNQIERSSTLYAKVLNALQTGKIPENGLKSLIKQLEVDRRVR